MRRHRALIAGLFAAIGLSGCGPSVVAEYAVLYSQASARDRQMEVGSAIVACVVQRDRSMGRCRVIEASPDTGEIRRLAWQGFQMYVMPDVPGEAKPGDVVRSRVRVGIHD